MIIQTHNTFPCITFIGIETEFFAFYLHNLKFWKTKKF